jgi:hypothetical protein
MIIQDRQRMTAAVIGQPDPALEVHLPEQVGRRLFEALMGLRSPRWGNNLAIPLQDLMDSRKSRWDDPVIVQALENLAWSPGRVGIPHGQNLLLPRRVGAAGACVRPA